MIPKAIDLFCGAGGLSSGLRAAGFDIISSFEFDSNAAHTYSSNFPESELHIKDVCEIDFTVYKGIDLLAGGPPCQPFSVAGKQLAHNDPRDMVPQFIRAVREASPKSFLMENVAGLLTKRHLEYATKAVTALQECGYHIYIKILSAQDYGVPQRRKRVFIVGINKKLDVPFFFPAPTHGDSPLKPYAPAQLAIATAPADEPNNAIITYAKKPVLRPSPYAGMLVNGQGRPINLKGPCHTIPATAGGNRTHIVDTSGVLLKYHFELQNGGPIRTGQVEGVRRLTAKESAKIQTFPDHYIFQGKKSSQYRQIGNAVPPLLAKHVGLAIKQSLEKNRVPSIGSAPDTFSLKKDLLGRYTITPA